ncbi:glycosyltransferase [Oceanicaulis sp. LC35]|uniref:glycosyltransferase n=1 Tax=Oceanicaulis sp. LC35 TaxID=3349635 RepID=UPI003F872597
MFGLGVLLALSLSARSLLRAFDKASVGWLAFAGVTGGFLVYRLLLAGLTYPGILSPDLEHMIHMITSFEITDKYSFPATLLTLAGAGLTGSITGIIALESALQLCGVYLAVSYALRSRMNLLASGALLAALLVLPASLFFSIYPGRDALFLYTLNAAFFLLALRKLNADENQNVLAEIATGFTLALPLTMRGEAVVMAPLLLLGIGLAAKSLRAKTLMAAGFLLASLGLTPFLSDQSERMYGERNYTATALLNPVHEIIYLSGEEMSGRAGFMRPRGDLREPLEKVSRVVDLEIARQSYDSGNIGLWFNPDAIRHGASDEDWAAFHEGAIELLVQNPHIYAANRARVLVATNGLTHTILYPHRSRAEDYERSVQFQALARPGYDPQQVERTLRLGAWASYFTGYHGSASWIIWSMLPALGLSLLVLAFWRSVPLAAVLCLANLARCGAVALTAPATFVTYYSTLYVSVWVIVMIALGEFSVRHARAQAANHFNDQIGKVSSLIVFAGIGGVGWLLDFGLFTALTSWAAVPPGLANVASSLTGALFAFTCYALTRWGGGASPRPGQIIVYAGYQLIAIGVFSALVSLLSGFFAAGGLSITDWILAPLAAKVCVTPVNLLMNYLASQFILKPGQSKLVSLSMTSSTAAAGANKPRTLVFIPAYRCEAQIGRVLAQLKGPAADWVSQVMVVDNQSPDGTIEAAHAAARELSVPWVIWRNADNYGLGGSHKAAMRYARENGFDYLVVLHGDDQADINDLRGAFVSGEAFAHDCFLGARFAPGARLQGYSWFRTFGNQVYNLLFSIVCRRRVYDLGSGLNLYRVSALEMDTINRLPDDLTFNYGMLMLSYARQQDVVFFPISWREEDQSSNVRLFRQAMRVLSLLGQRAWDMRSFFEQDHRLVRHEAYTGTIVHQSETTET